jgi:hypothetical protein
VEATVATAGWSRRVLVADTFITRWRGLRHSPDRALLIGTRSIHGFGMDRPLLAVALDADMRVIGSRVLAPNRIIAMSGARHWLELGIDDEPPRPGSIVRVTHV